MKAFDAAIAGGGIIGGSIAFELARHGLRVVLLDRQQPGLEASWAAAGMLSPAPDAPDALPLFSLARASFELFPEFLADVTRGSGISAGLRREGTLEVFLGEEAETERDLLVAGHRRLGLATEPASLADARQMEPALGSAARAVAWLPYEATVEPRALIEAVLAAAGKAGAELREGTPVTSLVIENGECTAVVAGGEKISAKHVVIAAGCYSSRIDSLERYAPTQPIRGQMLALRPSRPILSRVLRSTRGYLVPRNDGRIVAGSTLEDAGFEKRVTPSGLQTILAAALELAPALAEAAVVETWAGLRPGTPDHLPVLGPTDLEGLLIATGHYRNGILLAPITARLIREWVTGEKPSLPCEAYSPMRFREAPRAANR
jgi:glycine oxidase